MFRIYGKSCLMKVTTSSFNSIVESVYELPLEFKEELKTLLEHNIADVRREEIAENFKSAKRRRNPANSRSLRRYKT
jgi:hypothetical protein